MELPIMSRTPFSRSALLVLPLVVVLTGCMNPPQAAHAAHAGASADVAAMGACPHAGAASDPAAMHLQHARMLADASPEARAAMMARHRAHLQACPGMDAGMSGAMKGGMHGAMAAPAADGASAPAAH
jgi:hypothetical protein